MKQCDAIFWLIIIKIQASHNMNSNRLHAWQQSSIGDRWNKGAVYWTDAALHVTFYQPTHTHTHTIWIHSNGQKKPWSTKKKMEQAWDGLCPITATLLIMTTMMITETEHLATWRNQFCLMHNTHGGRKGGMATGYGLNSPGFQSRWRCVFRARSCWPWGMPSLLCNGYYSFFPRG